MRLASSAILLVICFAAPLRADVESDKTLIANTIFSDSTLQIAFKTMMPVLADAMDTQFRNQGITVSDPKGFINILTSEFQVRYAEIMREDLRPALGDIFTEQELADIAAFMQTPSGARFFAAQGELTQIGFRLGQIAGARAGQEASEKIAERLLEEGIDFTDANGNKVDTLKFLRGY